MLQGPTLSSTTSWITSIRMDPVFCSGTNSWKSSISSSKICHAWNGTPSFFRLGKKNTLKVANNLATEPDQVVYLMGKLVIMWHVDKISATSNLKNLYPKYLFENISPLLLALSEERFPRSFGKICSRRNTHVTKRRILWTAYKC